MGIRKYMTGLSGGRSRMKCYVDLLLMINNISQVMVPTVVEELDEKGVFVTQICTSRHAMAVVGYSRTSPCV